MASINDFYVRLLKVATASDHGLDDMMLRKPDILKSQTAQQFCT